MKKGLDEGECYCTEGGRCHHHASAIELAAREYDAADTGKLGAWVQANLQHHAGLSWSEGIAREFASLKGIRDLAEVVAAQAQHGDACPTRWHEGDCDCGLWALRAELSGLKVP